MRQAVLRRLERAAERAIGKAELPGFVLWAARDGEVVYHEAFGEAQLRPHSRPMRTDTVFDLASLTKVLSTTLILMKLDERGALAVGDPVTRFIPTFADRDEKKRDITLRHLLTHSSGLKAWVPYYEDIRARDRKRDTRILGTPEARPYVLDRIAMGSLIHEVGEASVYGDLGFIVLGEVVARAAGDDLAALFAEEVGRPLGLRHTGFIPLPSGEGKDAPPGGLVLPRTRFAATEDCSWRGRVLVGEVDDGNAWAVGGVSGHAGLFGTAEEVGKIALALMASYEGRGDLVARQVTERFFTRQDLPKGSDWALGWDTPTAGLSTSGRFFSPRSVGHTGFTGTSLWMDLDRRLVVVLLANRIHPIARKSRFAFRPRVHDLLMEALGLAPPRKKEARAGDKPPGPAAEAASDGGAGSPGDPLP
jgi:CubicO group peptidase (beta-lactamase class C family)